VDEFFTVGKRLCRRHAYRVAAIGIRPGASKGDRTRVAGDQRPHSPGNTRSWGRPRSPRPSPELTSVIISYRGAWRFWLNGAFALPKTGMRS
jgi:hypothetical protein